MSAVTVREALAKTEAALKSAGIDEARIEARRLVRLATGLDREAQLLKDQTLLSAEQFEALKALTISRCARRPLQHLEGWVEFFGLDFKCDARALIPRADSETLVAHALDVTPEGSDALIADLGTGTGCLLISVLKSRPNMRGAGIEASAQAAALAAENIAHHGLETRADIRTQSWEAWDGWSEASLILSNPPYIASAEINQLQPEVRDHDPRAALDGGGDGLAAYRSIFAASAQMKPGARLILEIGHDQGGTVSGLMKSAGFKSVRRLHDMGGRDRVVSGLKS